MTTVAHDKLTYVNRILRAVGMGPITALDQTRAAQIAEDALDAADAEVQERGWHFNTDRYVPIVPDGANNVIVPADALKIDPESTSDDLVQIGTKLWDRNAPNGGSFTITRTLKYQIVRYRNFVDLPTSAQDYIAAVAARKFQMELIGSGELDRRLAREEALALSKLQASEADNSEANSLRQSFSVARAAGRVFARRNPLLET